MEHRFSGSEKYRTRFQTLAVESGLGKNKKAFIQWMYDDRN